MRATRAGRAGVQVGAVGPGAAVLLMRQVQMLHVAVLPVQRPDSASMTSAPAITAPAALRSNQ